MKVRAYQFFKDYISKLISMRMAQRRPIQRNKVVFRSYHGTKYNDSPMYISECLYLEAKRAEADVDIVWITDGNIKVPQYVRSVVQGSKEALAELATAKIWVDNVRKDLWDRKRKRQFYIQTWHGGTALKKVEGDAEDKLSRAYLKRAHWDSRMADAFISCSKWNSDMYRRAFWYDGEVLEYGAPRSDIFYRDPKPYQKKVRDFFRLTEADHIVLYAPTFRNDESVDCYTLVHDELLEQLNKHWGGQWKLIIRLHPNIANKQNDILYDNRVLNGSVYSDINELIISADLLISDYSSCIFDAMEAKKRVIIYATDVERYTSERGLYFSFQELPFPVSTNNKELIDRIVDFNSKEYDNSVDCFKNQLGLVNDGNASLRCTRLIMEKMGFISD